jgi:signal transduction histidine kinase
MVRAVEQLSVWLGEATGQIRAAVNSLRMSTTEKNDLADAFRRAIEECGMHGPMKGSLSVLGDAKEMHPVVQDEVYRIGYEAIRNACMHSEGTQLEVSLTYARDFTVRVKDNGVGIDPAFAENGRVGHFGIQGMRERALRISAKLTITSSVSSGTEISVVIPGRVIFRKAIGST